MRPCYTKCARWKEGIFVHIIFVRLFNIFVWAKRGHRYSSKQQSSIYAFIANNSQIKIPCRDFIFLLLLDFVAIWQMQWYLCKFTRLVTIHESSSNCKYPRARVCTRPFVLILFRSRNPRNNTAKNIFSLMKIKWFFLL